MYTSPSILEDDDQNDVIHEVEAQVQRHQERSALTVIRRHGHPDADRRRMKEMLIPSDNRIAQHEPWHRTSVAADDTHLTTASLPPQFA